MQRRELGAQTEVRDSRSEMSPNRIDLTLSDSKQLARVVLNVRNYERLEGQAADCAFGASLFLMAEMKAVDFYDVNPEDKGQPPTISSLFAYARV